MKVGMVFECGPDGADTKVYTYLAKKLVPDIEIQPITLNNQKGVIRECGKVSKRLLEVDKCKAVVILWDLYPNHEKRRPCRKEDCEKIMEKLYDAGLTEKQLLHIHLVCVEKELESWLLADEQAISEYLCRLKKKECSVKRFKHPERPIDPKGELHNIFRNHIRRLYKDVEDAERIVRLIEIRKLRRCSSFQHFAKHITEITSGRGE
jgi:hypothetical protein